MTSTDNSLFYLSSVLIVGTEIFEGLIFDEVTNHNKGSKDNSLL